MVTLMCVLLFFLLSPERGVVGCKQEFTRQHRLGRITQKTLKKLNFFDLKSSRRGRQAETVEAEEEKCNTRKDPRWFAKAFFVNIQLYNQLNNRRVIRSPPPLPHPCPWNSETLEGGPSNPNGVEEDHNLVADEDVDLIADLDAEISPAQNEAVCAEQCLDLR